MATIHSTQSEGRSHVLGPVTITKLWPKKQGQIYLSGSIKDASGQSPFKIWGALANRNFQEGEVVTFVGEGPKGGITNKEYPEGSGKFSLNISDCRAEGPVSASEAHSGRQETTSYQAHPERAFSPSSGGDKLPDVMKRCAQATRLYIDELVVNQGFTKDEAIMLAQNAPAWYPLMWFGEKGMG
jgi:hypothetical protein